MGPAAADRSDLQERVLRERIAELEDALRQIADTQIAQAEPTARHMKTVARLALQGR